MPLGHIGRLRRGLAGQAAPRAKLAYALAQRDQEGIFLPVTGRCAGAVAPHGVRIALIWGGPR